MAYKNDMVGALRLAASSTRQFNKTHRQALKAALESLPPSDQAWIERATKAVQSVLHQRQPGLCGESTALEIVAAVGLLLESAAEDGEWTT